MEANCFHVWQLRQMNESYIMKVSEIVSKLVVISSLKLDSKMTGDLQSEIGRLQADNGKITSDGIGSNAQWKKVESLDSASVIRLAAANTILRALTAKGASSIGVGEYLLQNDPAFAKWVMLASERVMAGCEAKRLQMANDLKDGKMTQVEYDSELAKLAA